MAKSIKNFTALLKTYGILVSHTKLASPLRLIFSPLVNACRPALEPAPPAMLSAHGYTTVSDVVTHNLVPADIADIEELLATDDEGAPIDYAAIANIYIRGRHSVRRTKRMRPLRGFATSEERFTAYFPAAVAYYDSPTFLHDLILSAIKGKSTFNSAPDDVRRQAIHHGLLSLMNYWVRFKIYAAAQKVAKNNFKPADGAPSNWDEAFAFYYGPEGKASLYAMAKNLSDVFALDEPINDVVLAALRKGQNKLMARQSASTKAEAIVTQLNRAFLLSLVQSAQEISEALAAGEAKQAQAAQAKGRALYYAVAPAVAAISPQTDKQIVKALTSNLQPTTGDTLKTVTRSLLGDIGLAVEDMGTAFVAFQKGQGTKNHRFRTSKGCLTNTTSGKQT